MTRALPALALLVLAGPAAAQTVACTAADLCPAGGPSCSLVGAWELGSGCVGIDLSGVDLTMTAGSSLTTTDQSVVVLLGSLTMETGSEIVLPATTFGTESLELRSTGPVDLGGLVDLDRGTTLLVEASQITVGGDLDVRSGIELVADGTLTVSGAIRDLGSDTPSTGTALSAGSDLTITGSITNCCTSFGFDSFGGGPLTVSAGGDLLVAAGAILDQTADAPSDQDITLTADGSITVEGDLIADGSDYEVLTPSYAHVCDSGGTIAISARQDLTVSGAVSSRGTGLCDAYGCGNPSASGIYGCFDDSSAGAIRWWSLGSATLTGTVDTGALNDALAADHTVESGGLLTWTGSWTGAAAPGSSLLLASGAGDLRLEGSVGSVHELALTAAATSGSVVVDSATLLTSEALLDGCTLTLEGTTSILSTGINTYRFRSGGSVGAQVTSTGTDHVLEYFSGSVDLYGTLTPAAVPAQNSPDCTLPDTDSDGVIDAIDQCPGHDDLMDSDSDGIADGCDPCPLDDPDDTDGDGICDTDDACAGFDDAIDQDGDGLPDACDPCPTEFVNDLDGDGLCPSVDPCPADYFNDADGDGVCGDVDACEGFDDAIDQDADAIPDACDVCPADPLNDDDEDGVCDGIDICLGSDDYEDTDGDDVPDGCDPCPLDFVDDFDLDGVCESDDACPGFDDTLDLDADGRPDDCDLCPLDPDNDADGDGVCGNRDECPGFNDDLDDDNDGLPDGCDPCPEDPGGDEDGDGICDGVDPCVDATESEDGDGDGVPAACDCDDTDTLVGPDAREICDDRDNDCDGEVDEGCESEGGKGCGCQTAGPAPGVPALLVLALALTRRRER